MRKEYKRRETHIRARFARPRTGFNQQCVNGIQRATSPSCWSRHLTNIHAPVSRWGAIVIHLILLGVKIKRWQQVKEMRTRIIQYRVKSLGFCSVECVLKRNATFDLVLENWSVVAYFGNLPYRMHETSLAWAELNIHRSFAMTTSLWCFILYIAQRNLLINAKSPTGGLSFFLKVSFPAVFLFHETSDRRQLMGFASIEILQLHENLPKQAKLVEARSSEAGIALEPIAVRCRRLLRSDHHCKSGLWRAMLDGYRPAFYWKRSYPWPT